VDPTNLPVEELLQKHMPRVYNLAYRLLGNQTDAEELTQDVLLQVLRKWESFRGESSLATWLHRITLNAALSYRRKRAVREEHRDATPLDEVSSGSTPGGVFRQWSVTPEQELLNQETQELIENALARLPAHYRDVFVLADVEGLSNQEIADVLKEEVSTIKSRLHRARLTMRSILAPHFEEKLG
jgi:RNA polymerase sigma-70 factor (ECF subfamily)